MFEPDLLQAQQPWTVQDEGHLSPDLTEERTKLLIDVAESRLGTTEQRVLDLLQRFPETRDSDIALCIKYWKVYQAEIIERWSPLELEILYEMDKIETIGRVRRHIQNALRLCRGRDDTSKGRAAMQREFHEYLAAQAGTISEVRFYLDETGNEGDKAYTGVAGVCVMNWKQYEKHHASLHKWRSDQNWPGTIHFSETGLDRLDLAVRLLGQLQHRRSGLLFLGYALHSRGRTHEDLLSLMIQLVIDSLHHLKTHGSLDEPCSLRIVKEADTGFDSLYLDKMYQQLSELIAIEFPGQLVVQPIEPVKKGRNVLLECADLIAGGMQRRAKHKGLNPKDRLAEAVVNLTGFEDSADNGVVFKYYPIQN